MTVPESGVAGGLAAGVPRTTRPALRFDRESVRVLVPQRAYVVYRIYWGPQLAYIGSSAHPRARLLEHLRKDWAGQSGPMVELEFFRNPTAMVKAERLAAATERLLISSGVVRRHPTYRRMSRGIGR